jgi:hypothetical protein
VNIKKKELKKNIIEMKTSNKTQLPKMKIMRMKEAQKPKRRMNKC